MSNSLKNFHLNKVLGRLSSTSVKLIYFQAPEVDYYYPEDFGVWAVLVGVLLLRLRLFSSFKMVF